MGATDLKLALNGGNPLAVNCGKSTATRFTDAQRKMFEDAQKKADAAEVAWLADGSPWTDDQEEFLNRMTGI